MDATNRTSAEMIKPVAMAAPIATEKPRRGIAISSSHGTAERTSSVHPTIFLYLDHHLVKAKPAPLDFPLSVRADVPRLFLEPLARIEPNKVSRRKPSQDSCHDAQGSLGIDAIVFFVADRYC